MLGRKLFAAVLGVGLLPGMTALVHAQSALPLRGALADEPPPPTSDLAATTLDIEPLEPVPPPRRKAPADPYAPQGIGQGALRLYPVLTIGTVYTSNVNSSASDPESDIGLQLKPAFRFESDWVRHAWTGRANGNLVLYTDNNELNARSLDLAQQLRLDVRRDSIATFDLRYAIDQTGLGSSDIPATAIGNRTEHTLSGSSALRHDFGPMTGLLKAGLTGRFFEDVDLSGGGTENNDDRDYAEPSLALRATYADPPAFKPYVELAYTPRLHMQSVDRNGLRRSSQGLGLEAGVEVLAEPIWSGELGLTYLHRNYEDASLDPVNSFGVSGSLTWSPTELTRIVFGAGTSISETVSATQSGNPIWTASVAASHSLRDNLDLSAGAGIEIEDTGDAIDRTYDASVGLSWKLNPVLSWTAGYDLTWLDAGTGGRSYTEHRVSAGITLSR